MNKARRHEIKMLKYKKRISRVYPGLRTDPEANLYAYRSHGSPCSCYICSNQKYDRAKIRKVQRLEDKSPQNYT